MLNQLQYFLNYDNIFDSILRFDILQLYFMIKNLPIIYTTLDTMNGKNSISNCCYVIIFQENNSVGVLNNCTGITGKEIFNLRNTTKQIKISSKMFFWFL